MFFIDNNLEKIKETILKNGKAEVIDMELSDDKVILHFSDTTVLEIDYAEHEGLNIKAFQKEEKVNGL